MFKSATIKLTLWYVLIVMALSLVFSSFLYHFGTQELSEGLTDQYHQIVADDHDADDNPNISVSELNIRSNHLMSDLVYFNILVFLTAAIASYALARKTLKPIEKAHQAQVRFTAEASHELRTPLASMKAGTEATLMNNSATAVSLREALVDNLKDIERLDNLTDHLIELSRHDAQVKTKSELVDLESLTLDVLQKFSQPIKNKKIKIKPETEAVVVEGEPHGLEQLITIIVDNAVKYSQPKSTIRIRLIKKHDQAIISVADDGIGIPASDLPHVFERFYRSKNVTKTSHQLSGYGLGLPLAKDIAEIHGGSISVDSLEHHGTNVVISLPINQPR